MKHLQHKKMIDKITERLWITSSSLNGIGGLFTTGARDLCLNGNEFYGIGGGGGESFVTCFNYCSKN